MNLDAESILFYNSLKPNDLRCFSNIRAAYLNSIDEFVATEAVGGRYLDIGLGDGVRAKKISRLINATSLVGIDSSYKMCDLARMNGVNAHLVSLDDFEPWHPFDTITCLWNVLGDVSDSIGGMKKIYGMLADGGKAFIDVNNRYNLSEYGLFNVLRNMISPTRRYFKMKDSNCHVHIFSPWELDVIEGSRKIYVDYKTGEVRKLPFFGQILYVLEK